jgi:adenylate cyclase
VFRRPEIARERRAPGYKRAGLTIALAALAISLTATALWWVPTRPPVTIAVLPLDNLSSDAGSDYFVDGLTDEIIRNLSVIEGLTVRSRTSSFALKGQPRKVRDAGKATRS